MKKALVFTCVTIFVWSLLCSKLSAEDYFHPSRMEMKFFGDYAFNSDIDLEMILISSRNLAEEFSPIVYLGAEYEVLSWLSARGYFGWKFEVEEPLMSFGFSLHYKDFFLRGEIESTTPSWEGYWRLFLGYKFESWFRFGMEGEGWGNYLHHPSWSFGGGPVLSFRFGYTGLDLALHLREIDNLRKPEFVVRFNVDF